MIAARRPHARRLPVVAALLLTGALLAAACGGTGDETASEGCPVDALDDADGTTEITVWHTFVGLAADTIEGLAEDYNASQDRVRVQVENQGTAIEELGRKYRQAIPSGDLPELAVFDDTSVQFLADSGTTIAAGDCAEADGYTEYDDFLPVVTDYYTVDGVLQGASFNVATALIFYNRDHFEAAGLDPDDPPQTLEEVHEAARTLAAAGVTEQPLALHLTPFLFEFWTTGAGAGVVDNENGRGDGDTTEGTLSNDTTTEVVELFAEMDEEGLLNPVPGTEGQFDHYFAMGLESASMTLESSGAVTTINAVLEGDADPAELGLDQELPPIDVNLDAGEFPGLDGPGEGQVGGNVWYLTNTGSPAEQAASWDFVKFVNQPENQVRFTLQGSFLPSRTAALEDPALQEDWASTRSGRWLEEANAMLDRLDPDWPGPLIGPYAEFRDAVRDALDEVLFSGTDVGEALGRADETISDALTTYNDENF